MAGHDQASAEKLAQEKKLDDALKDTFPASDPIQQNPTQARPPRPKQAGGTVGKPH